MNDVNISGANNIESILEENGYPISRGANYISTAGLWRNGDNNTAICIYPEKNLVIDFVTSEKFSINTLIGKILGIEGEDKINEYLSNNNLNFTPSNDIQEPLIKETKILKKDFLDKLDKSDKSQEYWLNRGIKLEVLREFQGGIYKDRYYFPIYDKESRLIGLNSRDLIGNSNCKYRIKGKKEEFLYPIFLNNDDINKHKKVYLVEGIGCCLRLFSVGIRNVIVLFGTGCSWKVVNYLLTIPDIKIFISTDNDSAGIQASEKIYSRLRKYFDTNDLEIKLPLKKDFGEMSSTEISNWKIL